MDAVLGSFDVFQTIAACSKHVLIRVYLLFAVRVQRRVWVPALALPFHVRRTSAKRCYAMNPARSPNSRVQCPGRLEENGLPHRLAADCCEAVTCARQRAWGIVSAAGEIAGSDGEGVAVGLSGAILAAIRDPAGEDSTASGRNWLGILGCRHSVHIATSR